ncbi:after-VIT domain-containing protein [Pseudanabaena mucicola]|uniref:DUF4335 domain-containing protein n=1 Tax=Pseudanabaena mucicola FACHB-723 TaxID=2692860 RepID=A0ABR7ZRW1_9CYAN|nr:after-VIT domain-containing protein [Pseudanabaena mucicola]MBD2186694.1 DUF4335 domain-containing protein [Pseudanabaena mucicola FACHB-723]
MGNSFSQSNTLSRRYELPTCLLEVWTERSPLSDWQSQVVAQNLHFRLQLAHGRKVIKGNQQQILNLIEAITAYCDRWLAQDELVSLNHDINIPKLPKLRLSTLQLFDLYESLELCANEFVILPSLVLEVRRLSPNWLKVVAGAIAIIGLSIGAIRLVSREQPSWQMAVTPAASEQPLGQPLESIPPVAVLEPNIAAKSESKSAPKAEIKTGRQEVSPSAAQPNFAIAPITPATPAAPTPYRLEQSPSATQDLDAKNNAAQNNQVALATPDLSRGRESTADSSALPSVATSATKPSPSSSIVGTIANDKLQMDRTIALESAPSAPAAINPSSRMASPSTLGASGNAPNNQVALTTNIKVLQIQSALPNEVNTALVKYLQEQRFTTIAGVVALDLVATNDRISQIEIDRQVTTLEDKTAIAKLEKLLQQWRSPQAVTGKIRLVLQFS